MRRYTEIEQVGACEWRIQGTIYDSSTDAKFAAAKLFLNVRGVLVKPYKTGFTLFYWK